MFRRPLVPKTYVPLGDARAKSGARPPPYYHVHDGTLLFIGGTANADAVSALLAPQDLFPILDSDGRALASIWIGDFTGANLDSHRELQISLFATTTKGAVSVPSNPFSVFKALLGHTETLMVCHGLWNDTERVVDYNRDRLALDARFASAKISQTGAACAFSFQQGDGGNIAGGGLAIVPQDASESWDIARYLGCLTLMKAGIAPSLQIPVANTGRGGMTTTMVSRTFSRYRKQVTRRFGAEDRLTINVAPYRDMDFTPLCVQHMQGFELAFLPPTPLER